MMIMTPIQLERQILLSAAAAMALLLVGCGGDPATSSTTWNPVSPPLQAEPFSISEADIAYHLKTHHGGKADARSRKQAITKLTASAQAAQVALEAGVGEDPLARAEIARILIARHRELVLVPKIQSEYAAITEDYLRDAYATQQARFVRAEQRQLAVLWLNPGKDPQRRTDYVKKMAEARDWYLHNEELIANPQLGFSVLGIDYSEHAASRFKGGVIGWLGEAGGSSEWSKAVAEIAAGLDRPGAVSEVINNDHGVFLLRLMAVEAAHQTPFEEAKHELEKQIKQQIRERLSEDFENRHRGVAKVP
jgi:hypothetical protein